MLVFSGQMTPEWLRRHRDDYVLTVGPKAQCSALPRRVPDSDANPALIHGTLARVLHRATCPTLPALGPRSVMCGTRDELTPIMEKNDRACPACL